jgi:hypothetical protein
MVSARSFYLSGMGSIYLMAFVSYYVQYQGLYSTYGVTPTRNHLAIGDDLGVNWQRDFKAWWANPCLGLFSPSLQLDVDVVMEATAVIGTVLSLLAVSGLHSCFVFAALHLLYLSLYSAGQTFLGFQWDIFLLETGAMTIFYAPLWCGSDKPCLPGTLLIRFLAFKFMFSSGMVKLTARDDTWQNLSAMEYHFATTCLPTFEAWFFHNLPPFMLRLSTAITFFAEIPAVFLLIVPCMSTVRRMSAFLQVALMFVIMISGNYNWFNLHYALLMVPVYETVELAGLVQSAFTGTTTTTAAAATATTTNTTATATSAVKPSTRTISLAKVLWVLTQIGAMLAYTRWACANMFRLELDLQGAFTFAASAMGKVPGSWDWLMDPEVHSIAHHSPPHFPSSTVVLTTACLSRTNCRR